MSLAIGALVAAFLVARALYLSRRDKADREYGATIGRRYAGPELPPAAGRLGCGRLPRGRSAPHAYTGAR